MYLGESLEVPVQLSILKVLYLHLFCLAREFPAYFQATCEHSKGVCSDCSTGLLFFSLPLPQPPCSLRHSNITRLKWSHSSGAGGKEPACRCRRCDTWVQSLFDREDPLEEEMATHSSILAGESHGQRSLAGYSPWGHKESDMTEAT